MASCSNKVVENKVHDPFENINRSVFNFNQKFDDYVLKPVSDGYDKLPDNVKKGVSNHVAWASTPSTIVNSAIQLNAENFANASLKFLLNSLTIGFYDLDKATTFKHLDFGSSLAKLNVPSGPYIVVPFFGPRNARHFTGNVVANS